MFQTEEQMVIVYGLEQEQEDMHKQFNIDY